MSDGGGDDEELDGREGWVRVKLMVVVVVLGVTVMIVGREILKVLSPTLFHPVQSVDNSRFSVSTPPLH